MNILKNLAAASAVMVALASAAPAHADSNVNYWVANNTKNAIWITVYGNGFEGDKREHFCLLPGQSAENYVDIIEYTNLYIRAEVKQSTNSCSDHSNIHDLGPTMLNLSSSGRSQMTYSGSTVGQTPSINNTGFH